MRHILISVRLFLQGARRSGRVGDRGKRKNSSNRPALPEDLRRRYETGGNSGRRGIFALDNNRERLKRITRRHLSCPRTLPGARPYLDLESVQNEYHHHRGGKIGEHPRRRFCSTPGPAVTPHTRQTIWGSGLLLTLMSQCSRWKKRLPSFLKWRINCDRSRRVFRM